MTKYEKLLTEAEKRNIIVLEVNLGTDKKCGKCVATDKGNFVIVNSNVTDFEKYEILSEELGHLYTTSGNILSDKNINNIKQEKKARNWGYEKLVGLIDLINAFEKGIRSKMELIEYLNVTEEFLNEALKHYKEKYGMYYKIDNYIIYFEPTLIIVKSF